MHTLHILSNLSPIQIYLTILVEIRCVVVELWHFQLLPFCPIVLPCNPVKSLYSGVKKIDFTEALIAIQVLVVRTCGFDRLFLKNMYFMKPFESNTLFSLLALSQCTENQWGKRLRKKQI